MKRLILILLIIATALTVGCSWRMATLERAADIDVDLDSNDSLDVAYGGHNGTTAADGRANLAVMGDADDNAPTGGNDFSGASYIIPVVVTTDCSGVTGEGRACWDSDDDIMYIGDGAAAQAIGPETALGDITAVWGATTGDASALTGASGDSLDASGADYIIPLVVTTDCSGVTGEGRACWDSDDDVMYVGTGSAAQAVGSGTGDITAVWGVASGDASALTAAAGDSLDASSADYIIPVIVTTDCSAVTAEGRACWDSDDNILYIGNGSTAEGINQSGAGDITGVLGDATGAVPILYQAFAAISSTDATPDVSAGQNFRTANASATTITDFDGSMLEDGRDLWLFVNDANTTIDLSSSGIEAGNRSTDYEADNGMLLHFKYSTTDNQWHALNIPDEVETVNTDGFIRNDSGTVTTVEIASEANLETQIGTSMASETEAQGYVTTHAGQADPHTVYLLESALGSGTAAALTNAPDSSGGFLLYNSRFTWDYDFDDLTNTPTTLAGYGITDSPTAEDAAGINTGTATDQFATADAIAGSYAGSKEVAWTVYDGDTDTATGDGEQFFAVPSSMNGMNLVDVTASVDNLNSATGGTTTVMLRRVRGATAVDMCSTGVTIDYNAYTASDETVNTSNDDLQTGDKIYVDVDAVTTGAVQQGLSVTAVFRLP